MTEQQYLELCIKCDQLLLEKTSSTERVAISWLHVIREHPVFLNKYESVFKAPSKIETGLLQARSRISSVAGLAFAFLKGLRTKNKSLKLADTMEGGVDILFISHLLSSSQAGATDFYFGAMPEKLAKKGMKSAVALINHTSADASELAKAYDESKAPRFVLSNVLNSSNEYTIHKRLVAESKALNRYAANASDNITQRIAVRASLEVVSGSTRSTMRMAAQIDELVTRLQPKAIIVTYEGHAWERIALSSARAALKTVKCLAYQHAAIFRLQHAIRRNLQPEYNPDKILTAGLNSAEILRKAEGLKGVPISILGSVRATSESQHPDRASSCGKPVCLVLPEGIISECKLLFEVSLHCALRLPNASFIWRLHPLVQFDELQSVFPQFRELPGNITLSKESIESDIAASNCALYRGSTAIVNAILGGCAPIYLKLADELTIDPLFEISVGKVCIASVGDLSKAVASQANARTENADEEFNQLRQYCLDYFADIDIDLLRTAV